jgi:hypothetical protein
MGIDLQKIQALCDGFEGEFLFRPAHTEDRGIGNVADFVD